MFADEHDSDQSISEEEDVGLDSSKNYSFSLSSSAENKERNIQVLSQLEILRKDAFELGAITSANISSEKRQTGLSVEDEIEFPVFGNEDDFIDCPRVAYVLDSDEEIDRLQGLASICNSDEEIISDEEKLTPNTFGSAKVDGEENTWSGVNREVEALVCLNENTGCCLPVGSSSKLNRSSKGGRRKVKPNLLFRFRSHLKALPLVVTDANEIGFPPNDSSQWKELHASANRDMPKLNTESLQVLDGRDAEKQEIKLLSFVGGSHDCNKHSVTELLECLQEKSGLAQGNSEIRYRLEGRTKRAVTNRDISAVGYRNMDSVLDVGSSSEDEDDLPNSKPVLQQRTIADQFHEAIEAVSEKDLMPGIFHRGSCIGLFEKLQNVMVIEKERDMDFLKKLQMDRNSTDGRGFLDVRILSRSLEAKLNVCCCALLGDKEWLSYFQMRNQTGERTLNIIFSARTCSDVELEVGNVIRVYSPWKEVNIKGKYDIIILSTYFSQM